MKDGGTGDYKIAQTKIYKIMYSSDWKEKEKSDELLRLSQNNATFELKIKSNGDSNLYKEIEELHDDLIYNMNLENKEYSFLSEEEIKITKAGYKGYQVMYETEDSNALIEVFKDYDRMYFFTYEAKIDVFDHLLENVKDIIYNFELLTENEIQYKKWDLSYTNITYDENENMDQIADNTVEKKIADENYRVKFTAPAAFEDRGYYSTRIYASLDEEKIGGKGYHSIYFSANVRNYNIYEYLDPTTSYSPFYASNYTRKEEEFSEQLEKINDTEYIYRYNYSSYGSYHSSIKKVKAIDKNHVFEIEFEGSFEKNKGYLTKKLIDSVKILDIEHINQDIDPTHTLKIKSSAEDVSLSLNVPDKYIQYQSTSLLVDNIFETQRYGLNYDEKNDMYQYEINYELSSLPTSSKVKIFNENISNTYGESVPLTEKGQATYNGHEFTVYEGSEVKKSGIILTDTNRSIYTQYNKVLGIRVSDEFWLLIEIKGNGVNISEDMINELTNFNIN